MKLANLIRPHSWSRYSDYRVRPETTKEGQLLVARKLRVTKRRLMSGLSEQFVYYTVFRKHAIT